MSYRFDGYSSIQPNNGVDGYQVTIAAQSSTGAGTRGGDLVLRSGAGTNSAGNIRLFAGDTEVARVSGGKFVMSAGQRVTYDIVTTTPYDITDGYYVLLINTTSAKTVNLPATPANGDVYNIKDMTGNAAANNITVSGNGKNIDGVASYIMNTNYSSSVFMYNGTTWSVL